MDLKLEVKELTKGYVLIVLAGDMDAYASIQFKNVVNDLIKKGKYRLISDIEKVTCIDSVGAGRLMEALKKTQEKKGDLWLVYNKSKAKRFLEVTGLNKNFTVFRNRGSAYKKL